MAKEKKRARFRNYANYVPFARKNKSIFNAESLTFEIKHG